MLAVHLRALSGLAHSSVAKQERTWRHYTGLCCPTAAAPELARVVAVAETNADERLEHVCDIRAHVGGINNAGPRMPGIRHSA